MTTLKPCPFCGGEAAIEQTGKNELTLRCVGVQPSGLLGCGPKYVQKAGIRFTLEWLAELMAEKWNRRSPIEAGNGGDGWLPIEMAPKNETAFLAVNSGEIDRWHPNEEATVITVRANNRPFTCAFYSGGHMSDEGWTEDSGFIDEFGEVYRADGIVGDAEDLTASDNVLRLTHWRPLPSPPSPSSEGEKQP